MQDRKGGGGRDKGLRTPFYNAAKCYVCNKECVTCIIGVAIIIIITITSRAVLLVKVFRRRRRRFYIQGLAGKYATVKTAIS